MTTVTAPTVKTFLLPDVGEGLTEAEIVAWHVAVGDTVAVNQAIVDIETAKSVFADHRDPNRCRCRNCVRRARRRQAQ